MTPTQILDQATAAGLTFEVSEDGSVRTAGDENLIEAWAPILRAHKAEISEVLQKDFPRQRVMEMLASNPDQKYALIVGDASTDPVRVMVGIKGIATFQMEIPHAHYDGIALIDVLNEYSAEAALKLFSPLSEAKECSLELPIKQEGAA